MKQKKTLNLILPFIRKDREDHKQLLADLKAFIPRAERFNDELLKYLPRKLAEKYLLRGFYFKGSFNEGILGRTNGKHYIVLDLSIIDSRLALFSKDEDSYVSGETSMSNLEKWEVLSTAHGLVVDSIKRIMVRAQNLLELVPSLYHLGACYQPFECDPFPGLKQFELESILPRRCASLRIRLGRMKAIPFFYPAFEGERLSDYENRQPLT